jgi:hypothetical protein
VRATTHVAGRSKDTTELDGRGRPVRWFSQNYQEWTQIGGFPVQTDRRIVRHVETDALGDRIAKRSLPYEEGALAADILYDSYAYDGAGRVVERTTPWSATTTHQYYGRVTITTDAIGTQTVTESDGSGRPETIVAAGATTSYGYGPFGLLHDETLPGQGGEWARPAGGAGGTTYWHASDTDAAGRLVHEVFGNGAATTRTYDEEKGPVE